MAEHPTCGWRRYLHDDAAYEEVCNRPATVQFVFNQGRPGEFTDYRCDEHAERLRERERRSGRNLPESPVKSEGHQ
jgi:hypothetical protein